MTSTTERIEAARRLLEQRLDEQVPLEELAAAAHYSMFHFHRLFRSVVGETVREHQRRLRLERAAHRLVHGDADILSIAIDAGYDSHEAFTRAFRRRFDVAPSAFRDERREVRARKLEVMQMGAIRIERRQPQRVAYVRHVGPYSGVGDAWATLMKWGWMKMLGGMPETFGLCFDDPDVTPEEKTRYEACMVVNDKAKAKGAVLVKEIPGGVYAVTVHEGPFEAIGQTYAALCGAVASGPVEGRSWTLGDPPSLEKYLTDPRKTDPANLRTEVWMPVQ
ncbi:MAG: AraC family transcriptional regulator [Planctomycetota bacterium]